jgi:hypothetical protein
MKNLIFVLAIGFVLPAQAATYKCSVENFDDASVEVNLKSSKAAFFDNNEWSILGLADSPMGAPAALYEFSGQDADGNPLSVAFDSSEIGGAGSKITFVVEGDILETKSLKCSYVAPSELSSGI